MVITITIERQDDPFCVTKWVRAAIDICGSIRGETRQQRYVSPDPEAVVGPGWRIRFPSNIHPWSAGANDNLEVVTESSRGRAQSPPKLNAPVNNRGTSPIRDVTDRGTSPMKAGLGPERKSLTVGTQTSTEDWGHNSSLRSPVEREDVPQVDIETMTSESSPISVERDEVVLIPQPVNDEGREEATARVVTSPEASMVEVGPAPTHGEVELLMPDFEPSCPTCRRPIGNITGFANHYRVCHPRVSLMYKCRKCDRANANWRSISCHIPKCKGGDGNNIPGAVSGAEFECEFCPLRFETQVGLTQHKRQVHPVERNRGLVEEAQRAMGIKGTKLWSVEEANIVIDLSHRFADRPDLDQYIADQLGSGKTSIQVRSKRRVLKVDKTVKARDGPQRSAVPRATPEPATSEEAPQPAPDIAASAIREAVNRGEAEGVSEMKAIAELLKGADQDPGLVESLASEITSKAGKAVKSLNRPVKRKGRIVTQSRQGCRRLLREEREIYRKHQELYKKDPSKLAALVLDGEESVRCTIPIEVVHEAFRGRWEEEVPFQGLGNFRSASGTDNSEFYRPILAKEVMEALNRMKNSSAPGPDKISKKALLAGDPKGEQLARLYSAWLVKGEVPKSFKESRTKLLPKSVIAEELGEVNGWRPVTIGSVILRVFSSVLTQRLARACPLNPRQRGFIYGSEGCADNLLVLNTLIRRARASGRGIAVVFIDFEKAFDRISHEHILCAMKQRGIDQHVIRLITNLYEDCVTRVESAGQLTAPIHMKVGVKQGDPASPELFNLGLDPLIQALDECGTGVEWEGETLSTMAFADDLVELAETPDEMVVLLGRLEEFCQLTGLKVQPKKCHGFFLDKNGVVNNCKPWVIAGTPINMVGPGETIKYLGVQVGPNGIATPDLMGELETGIRKISRAPLKPSQRVKLLKVYLLPRLVYRADLGEVPATSLAKLDMAARKAVKEWLHLPACTANGLVYARNKDGGLGIDRLERSIPTIQVRRIYRMSRSSDFWIRQSATRTVARPDMQKRWVTSGADLDTLAALRSGVQTTSRNVIVPDWREEERKTWSALKVQGVGVDHFRGDRISNQWLGEPTVVGFKQRHYIAGLAVRAGTYPTREFLARGRSKEGAECRHCQARLESCSHILGQCPHVKGSRVRRHHKVRDLLADEAEKAGWVTRKEFRVETPEGNLRIPDLVCTRDGQALIIDVTIRYEMEIGGQNTLTLAATEKVEYYQTVADQIANLLNVDRATVMGFPVGARGKWPPESMEVLVALGLSVGRRAQVAKLISRRTLLYSLDVLRDFTRQPV